MGFQALFYNNGSNNVGLGFNAGSNLTTGSGNVCIGNGVLGVAGESNTTRIRNIYPRSLCPSSLRQLGQQDRHLGFSRRFKEDIKPMDKASEAILALKPVTFRYKKEIDAYGTLQFGLVAEEVADINPDLVTRDEKASQKQCATTR